MHRTWAGGDADDELALTDGTSDDRPRPHDRARADAQTLQDTGVAADGDPLAEFDGAGDVRAGQDRHEVAEYSVMAHGGVVVDLNVATDPDTGRQVSVGEHDRPGSQYRLGTDDCAGMDDGAGDESAPAQQSGQALTDDRVADSDYELRVFRGVLGVEHRQSPAARSRPPLVEEGSGGLAAGDECVEGLATEAAGTGNVERHGGQGGGFGAAASTEVSLPTAQSAPGPAAVGPAAGVPGPGPAWMRGPREACRWPAGDRYFDLVGFVLVASLAAWTTLVGLFTGGDPIPALAMFGAVLGAFGVARSVSLRIPWLAPAAVVLAGALLPFVPVGGTVATGQRFGPLQYANASALFYVVVAAAGGMLTVKAEGRSMRLVGALAMTAAAASVAVSGSEAAVGLLLLLPVAALVRRPPTVRRFVVSGAILVLAAVATTALLGMLHAAPGGPQTFENLASTAFTERRLDLWRDALQIVAHAPGTGVGPGEFSSHSPTSLRDQDAVAAHDEYLQVAAELGLPGLLLALLVTLWGFWRLHRAVPDRAASFAAAALTAAGIHASVDYVLHAPAILVAVVTLLGAVSAPALSAPERAPNLTGRRLRP